MLIAARHSLVLLLCAALAAPGCATARGATTTPTPGHGQVAVGPLLPDYVQQLPIGTPVRIERARGKTLRGTLIKATPHSVVIQPRTRIPEPPVEVPLGEVLSLVPDPERGASLGRAIAAGVAAGAGTALAVFFVIVALYAD